MSKPFASKTWKTPLVNMTVKNGKATIPDAKILATGQWKGVLISEKNLEEVLEWQKTEGSIIVVKDHNEDMANLTGMGDSYKIIEDPSGFKVILSDLEIVDEQLVKNLELIKEKGGGFVGISPRIDWEEADEYGNVTGLKTPHISIVVHAAQGEITGLSDDLISIKGNTMKDDKLDAKNLKDVVCSKCGTLNYRDAEKCVKCSMELSKKEVPLNAEGDFVIPASLKEEMEQITANKKADIPALRGFIERVKENMKQVEEKVEDKKKEDKEEIIPDKKAEEGNENTDSYSNSKKQSYAFPSKPESKKLAEKNKWRKELLPQGLFMHPAGVGLLPIGEDFIEAVIQNTKSVFGDKQVPITIGHPKGEITPDKTVGWLGDFTKDNSLFGDLEITNSLVVDAIDETTLRDCSLGINLDYKDEHGKLVGPTITHLALTNMPYFKKLSAFSKLAASEDVHVDVLDPVKGVNFVNDDMMKSIEKMQEQYVKISEKYSTMLAQAIDLKKETCLTELDSLIETELVRPGAKKRFVEYINVTSSKDYDDKRSVAEVFVDILKTGLLKSEVKLSSQITVNTEETKEALSLKDFKDFDIPTLIRAGKISHDASGRPFWGKGRPQ